MGVSSAFETLPTGVFGILDSRKPMHRLISNRVGLWAFVASILGGTALLLSRGPDKLDRWKAEKTAQGEKLSLKDLGPDFTPEMAVSMQKFVDVVSRLRSGGVDPGDVEMMHGWSPGYARVAWQTDSPETGSKLRWSWAQLAAQINSNAPVLRELQTVLQSPERGPGHDIASLTSSFRASFLARRKGVQWLASAEIDALRRGALDEAVTNLIAIVALARMNEEDGSLSSQMLRMAMAGYGVSATWEALQSSGWSEASLAALQAQWEKVKLLSTLERAIEWERARGILQFDAARAGRNPQNGLVRVMGLNSTSWVAQTFNQGVYVPVWQKAWSRHDELLFLKRTQAALDAVRAGCRSGNYSTMRPILEAGRRDPDEQLTTWNDFQYQLGSLLSPSWETLLAGVARQETLGRMVVVAIALKRHELRHGRAPERLAALAPEFFSAVPRDYMTGQELCYERNADGSFVLYSAGENGRDEEALGDDVAWPLAGLPDRVTDPTPGPERGQWGYDDVPAMETVTELAKHLHLALCFDPRPAEALTNRVSIRFEHSTAFETLEAILGNFGLLITRGPKHRLNCVVADPYPWSYYYDEITNQPSSDREESLIAIDGVPFTDAIRNLARHAGINFQFDPEVTAREHSKVTLRCENESAEEVLKRLVRERGLVLLRHKATGIARIAVRQD